MVSRKYGRSSARCVGVEVAAVERRALARATARAASRAATSSASDLSPLAALRRFSIWRLDRLEVGQGQLDLERPEVLERVGRAGDVVVVEGPQHEDDGVDLADAGRGTGCPGPRPCWPPRPGRRCRRTAPRRAPRSCELLISARASSRWSGTLATPTLGSVVAKAYGRGEGASRRRGRCRARTCPRWGARRTRSVPCPPKATGPLARS